MGIIKQLYNFLKTTKIYPVTKTRAVYDDNGKRLDNTLEDISKKDAEQDQAITELNSNKVSFVPLDKTIEFSNSDTSGDFSISEFGYPKEKLLGIYAICLNANTYPDRVNIFYPAGQYAIHMAASYSRSFNFRITGMFKE